MHRRIRHLKTQSQVVLAAQRTKSLRFTISINVINLITSELMLKGFPALVLDGPKFERLLSWWCSSNVVMRFHYLSMRAGASISIRKC